MSPLRWAVIGTGGMANIIAAAIRDAPGAELVAIVGRTHQGATAFATRHGASTAHAEFAAALGPDIDAVYVGSPNALHAAHTREALTAGKHVLCDKPLSTDVAEAKALLDLAAARRLTLGVNYQIRQHPGRAQAGAWLRAGEIGDLVAVRASVAFGTEELIGWRSDPELAGAAALYNLGVHAIDTVLAIVDRRPLWVSGTLRPEGARLDRTALVTIAFQGGALASVLASQELADDDVRMELLGTHGRITWNGWMAPYRGGRLTLHTDDGRKEVHELACPDAYERVVREFTRVAGTRESPDPSPAAALMTVRVVEAARASARLHTNVEL